MEDSDIKSNNTYILQERKMFVENDVLEMISKSGFSYDYRMVSHVFCTHFLFYIIS